MLVITDRALLVATKTTEAQKLLDGLAGFLRHRNRPLKLVLKDSHACINCPANDQSLSTAKHLSNSMIHIVSLRKQKFASWKPRSVFDFVSANVSPYATKETKLSATL